MAFVVTVYPKAQQFDTWSDGRRVRPLRPLPPNNGNSRTFASKLQADRYAADKKKDFPDREVEIKEVP